MNRYRVVCFDLDGTVIDGTIYIWQTIHDFLGTDEKRRKKAREDFYGGRISYREWAEHDIKLWIEKGLNRKKLLQSLGSISLMPGARECLYTLKEQGLKLGVVSGSLETALAKVLPEYREIFEHIFVNRLTFDEDENLEGIEATPYEVEKKAEGLRQIATLENASLSESVFIGDNDNDVHAARKAGLSIAFNCKSRALASVCDVVIDSGNLKDILPYIL